MKLPIDVKHILKQMGLGTYQIPKENDRMNIGGNELGVWCCKCEKFGCNIQVVFVTGFRIEDGVTVPAGSCIEKENETEADQREAYEKFCNDHLPPIYDYGDGKLIKEDSIER